MSSECTQCMCKNTKFNPLNIKKLRAFHKTRKTLYPQNFVSGIIYMCTCTYNNTLPF